MATCSGTKSCWDTAPPSAQGHTAYRGSFRQGQSRVVVTEMARPESQKRHLGLEGSEGKRAPMGCSVRDRSGLSQGSVVPTRRQGRHTGEAQGWSQRTQSTLPALSKAQSLINPVSLWSGGQYDSADWRHKEPAPGGTRSQQQGGLHKPVLATKAGNSGVAQSQCHSEALLPSGVTVSPCS